MLASTTINKYAYSMTLHILTILQPVIGYAIRFTTTWGNVLDQVPGNQHARASNFSKPRTESSTGQAVWMAPGPGGRRSSSNEFCYRGGAPLGTSRFERRWKADLNLPVNPPRNGDLIATGT